MLLVIVGRFIEGDETVNLMPPNTRCSRPACGWRSFGRLSFFVSGHQAVESRNQTKQKEGGPN